VDSTLVFFVAVVAVTSTVGLVRSYFSREQRARRALKELRRTGMRNAREGERCKIVGRLEYADGPLLAPFTARECACYSVRIHHDDTGQREFLREDRCGDFLLRDEDGTYALVRGTAAQVVVTKDAHFRSLAPLTAIWPKLEEPPPRVEAFLNERGKSMKGFFTKTLRFDEGVLQAGELVAVIGVAKWEVNPHPRASGGYREAPKLLTFTGSAEDPLIISDDPETTT
jgi:hypothetical protein